MKTFKEMYGNVDRAEYNLHLALYHATKRLPIRLVEGSDCDRSDCYIDLQEDHKAIREMVVRELVWAYNHLFRLPKMDTEELYRKADMFAGELINRSWGSNPKIPANSIEDLNPLTSKMTEVAYKMYNLGSFDLFTEAA